MSDARDDGETTERVRAAAVAQTVAQIKAIEADGGPERARLGRIRDALVRLGAQTELFPEADFPAPEDGTGDRLFRLWMEPDETYALYLNRGTGAKDTPPHNHTTWACVVGVRGQERNKFYRRTDDGSEPGRGALEFVEERTVERGTGVAMTGEDIHSIHMRGDEVQMHLHMYGLALHRLDARLKFDQEAGTTALFGGHPDVTPMEERVRALAGEPAA
ncbi:MAG: cysteine dioxygenase [Marivibrio sp.]|uniref:cysteine dioxygenase family protein n=1 Tax=Marivibrio sp. TaxID=2039719 RepID=UPI0032EAE0CF